MRRNGIVVVMNPTLRRLLPSIVISVLAPVVIYYALRTPLHSDVLALAIGGAVPVVWTACRYVATRRLDPIGLLGVAGFAAGALVAWLSGGNPIMLELRDTIPTGLLGLVVLGSSVIGKPFTLVLIRWFGRNNPKLAHIAANPSRTRTVTVFNLVLGALLLVHAAALIVLALSVPIGTYLVVSRVVGWGIIAIGVGALYYVRHRIQVSRVTAVS